MTSNPNDKITVKETLKSIYKRFCENTAIHGLGRTLIRSRLRRIVWIVLVLASLGWGMYQLVETLQKFFQYPVTSVIKLKHPINMPFPAVTICNLNRLRKSFLPQAILQDIHNNYANIEQRTTSDIAQDFFLERVELEHRQRASHNISNMLTYCTFNQENCTERDFTQVTDSINEHCYTFNREGNAETRYTTQAGPMYGLIVELNIELEEYLSITSTAGVKVIVHDPNVPPFPEDGGIVVQPGLATNIGIEKTEIVRLSEPYGTCDMTTVDNVRNLYRSWNYTYTENGCKKSCFQKSLYDYCACCHISLPCSTTEIFRMAGKAFTNTSIPYCDYKNKDNAECMNKVTQLFKNDKRKCGQTCPPACRESTYRTVVSSGFWPTKSYLALFSQQANQTSESWLKSFRDNHLKLHVYYSSLEITDITTRPDYDMYKVLGDIGGQLGLMLGASILTAGEILELVSDVLIVYVRSVYSWFFTRKVTLSS